MALCPYCGKAAHGIEANFDCPGRSALVAVPPAAPIDIRDVTSGSNSFDVTAGMLGTKLSAGTKVGEYEVLTRIGEGGMGTVYSAVHPIIGKKVAIKVLAARLAKNKNAIRRFVLEARAVNDIQHPGLVDIFSFGQLTDGRHYYVMEFLEGKNLGDVLRERIRLPMEEALPIFIEVGRALVAVHSKGIVHRDLKPENILLLSSPQPGGQKVKLVDFGLAKLVEGVPTHLTEGGPRTAAGVNVGTPHYMSPEQCRGLKVDVRADLYALGVLLYETLTGTVPFDGPTALDIWQAHVERPPRIPSDVAPGAVSPALNAVILRLLAKQPECRIQSAADFCLALENLDEEGQPRHSTADLRGSVWRHFPAKGPLPDEFSTTTEDLPAVQMPEVEFTDEERRQEIEELGSSLGLRIEEPATDSQEAQQMSALVIDLGPPLAASEVKAASQRHSLPLAAGGTKHRHTSRPIEERHYVPPLAAPSARPTGRAVDNRPSSLSRLWRVVRAVLVVALLVAATVVAVKLVR